MGIIHLNLTYETLPKVISKESIGLVSHTKAREVAESMRFMKHDSGVTATYFVDFKTVIIIIIEASPLW